MVKNYNLMFNIGKVRYVINYHDGVDTHKDGSPFYGIKCFSNKKKRDACIKKMEAEGYVETESAHAAKAKAAFNATAISA